MLYYISHITSDMYFYNSCSVSWCQQIFWNFGFYVHNPGNTPVSFTQSAGISQKKGWLKFMNTPLESSTNDTNGLYFFASAFHNTKHANIQQLSDIPPIDPQNLSGHITCFIRGEKDKCRSHFFRLSKTPKGNPWLVYFLELFITS